MDANEKRDALVTEYNDSVDELHSRIDAFENLSEPDEETETAARDAVRSAEERSDELKRRLDDFDADQRARAKHVKAGVSVPAGEEVRIDVDEPDMYDGSEGRQFLYDAFRSQIMHDPTATRRIADHQAYELEKRAMTTTTFGGLIPPQYLVDMYAKALRNGRVFADQVNHQDLPEIGMNLIIPRLTQGTANDIQSAENVDVATQDMVETDLTVPVRTIAGYVPVSRQGLERAQYNEQILFEDLVARYWADLDTQCINGDGTGVNILGLLNTVGIKTSAASSSALWMVYQNIADVIQQINTAVGGLGYAADKIVMHPRRWGSFVAAHDTTDRPIIGINGNGPTFNTDGQGTAAGYGFVGNLQGLPVYIDANVPTDLSGDTTDCDAILVFASGLVHLWERANDPVTLAFEQQAGTALSVRLIDYGYVAFTAGRYPAACGAVTGLEPPTFGT